MDKEAIIHALSRYTEDQLQDLPDYFLVQVSVTPANQVTIYIDADHGASIDKLAGINRALYKKIEETALFGENGNFSLDVSSPGLDEPLKLFRQYKKNEGRQVEVLLTSGIKETGLLKLATADGIQMEKTTGKKKNMEVQTVEIPFNQIKFTKVRVVF